MPKIDLYFSIERFERILLENFRQNPDPEKTPFLPIGTFGPIVLKARYVELKNPEEKIFVATGADKERPGVLICCVGQNLDDAIQRLETECVEFLKCKERNVRFPQNLHNTQK